MSFWSVKLIHNNLFIISIHERALKFNTLFIWLTIAAMSA